MFEFGPMESYALVMVAILIFAALWQTWIDLTLSDRIKILEISNKIRSGENNHILEELIKLNTAITAASSRSSQKRDRFGRWCGNGKR